MILQEFSFLYPPAPLSLAIFSWPCRVVQDFCTTAIMSCSCFVVVFNVSYSGCMLNYYGDIYISSRAICDALGITRQQLDYYCKKYMGTPLMRRVWGFSNVRVGKRYRKKYVLHYSVLFLFDDSLSNEFAASANFFEAILWAFYAYKKVWSHYLYWRGGITVHVVKIFWTTLHVHVRMMRAR